MSDAAIIDAYERAYAVAQAVGADGRTEDIPQMRDRQTMARRVRGYVISGKGSHGVTGGPAAAGTATSRERKALATMGRKGGKKAAQRWQDDPNGDYARSELEKLGKANQRRQTGAKAGQFAIASWFMAANAETGMWPAIPEAMIEFGVSRETVKRALRTAGIKLPRGRRQRSD